MKTTKCPQVCSAPGSGILILGRKSDGTLMRPKSCGLAWHQRIAEWLADHRSERSGLPVYRPCLVPTTAVLEDGERIPALRVSRMMQSCPEHASVFDDVMAFAAENDLEVIG